MRQIKYIVLHCTATAPTAKVEAITGYWKNTLKWKSPGYHYLIEASGKVHNLQPEDKPTNGVAGYNANSVHVSYIGGVVGTKPTDTRTPAQEIEMERIVRELKAKYPGAKILGHRDFPGVSKACPSFDVATWLKEVNI